MTTAQPNTVLLAEGAALQEGELLLRGTAVALALLPAATLGLMAAAREASEGKFPMPTVLASAFRAGKARLTAMLQLGAYYAAGFLLVMGISALFDGGQFAQLYLGGGNVTPETVQSSDFQTAMTVGMLVQKRVLPTVVMYCPGNTSNQVWNQTVGACTGSIVQGSTERAISFATVTPVGSLPGQTLQIEWTADAEL